MPLLGQYRVNPKTHRNSDIHFTGFGASTNDKRRPHAWRTIAAHIARITYLLL
jgi:hypothetical protein